MTIPEPEPRHQAPHLAASTSSTMSLRVLLDAVTSAGGNASALLRRVGVPSDTLRRLDARIPFDALMRAWELAPAMVGDDAFGLHVGAAVARGAYGLVEYGARASATLRQAIDRLLHHQRLMHDRLRFAFALSGPRATLSAWIAGRPTGPRHFNEAVVAALLKIARDVTGVDIVPLEIAFQHAEPASLVEHRRLLRAPLRFGAAQNQIAIARAVLELPLRESDPALTAVLDNCATHALDRLPPISDGIRLCRELIASQLGASLGPRLVYIARELAVSPRSLQRLLAAAGWSFRSLVDDVRRELAVALVAETDEHAAQIAYRLGYADASAFHHAFRRWTGHTVTEIRRRGVRPHRG